MERTTTSEKRIFSMKISELPAVALVYYNKLSASSELKNFTAKDPSVDASWLSGFNASITAVKNILPSETIIKKNKDLTTQIESNSKKCVELGTELSYWLNKTYPDNQGTIESFPIIAANDAMRNGNTEDLIEHLNTIIEQITAHQPDLTANSYPADNKTKYEALHNLLESLNTQQETLKQAVPDNTDQATTLRNNCYKYIQTILNINDFLYKNTDSEKWRSYLLTTVLERTQGGKSQKVKDIKQEESAKLN